MKSFVRQLNHYLPLIGILVAGVLGVVLFSSDRRFQQVVVVAASAGYVAWGIIHHISHEDLTFSIIVEYFTVAMLGLVIVFSILFRV